jgi:glycosyltransferase 2 family protein
MTDPSGSRRFPWHALFVAALTAALVWGFARGLDFAEVGRHIRSAHVGWVAASAAMTLAGYLLRARRWQVLLAPIGPASFRNTFRTTIIGFTATNLLPGRLGEVLRPLLIARAEGFQFSSALATIIIERLLDMASILLLFAWFLLTTKIDIGRDLKAAGALAGLAALGALVALVVSAGHPERLGRWAGRLAALLPGRVAEAVARFVRTLAEGLAVMRRPAPLVAALVLSILLWLSIALSIWMASAAFGVRVSPVDSFLVVSYLAVGVSLPTPGGLGGFHWAYKEATTRVFLIDPDSAAAAAMVLHAVMWVPVTLMGLVFMWQDGLSWKSIRRVKDTVSVDLPPQPSERPS